MGKNNKEQEQYEANLEIAIKEVKVLISEDSMEDKVKYFRDKQYNDNQIASLLQIPVQVVSQIK